MLRFPDFPTFLIGLPLTQGNQGNSGNFQVVENLR